MRRTSRLNEAGHLTPAATIDAALRSASARLAATSASPRLDAELLLGEVLGLTRPALIVRGGEPLGPELEQRFASLIERRAAGAPVAYLTGEREFWSLPLTVTPAVLVPRPETETLVERALEHLPKGEARTVLDLGTGSGAIAIALALERPAVRVIAVDRSPEALAVARENAARLAPGRIELRLGSWFEPLAQERVDLIVANPPYIAANDPVLTTLEAEPAGALIAGATGLEALMEIIAAAPRHLLPGGALLLEHGAAQAQAVTNALAAHGFVDVHDDLDHAGRPRIAAGHLPPSH